MRSAESEQRTDRRQHKIRTYGKSYHLVVWFLADKRCSILDSRYSIPPAADKARAGCVLRRADEKLPNLTDKILLKGVRIWGILRWRKRICPDGHCYMPIGAVPAEFLAKLLVMTSMQAQVSYNKSVFIIKKRVSQEGKVKKYGFPFARE